MPFEPGGAPPEFTPAHAAALERLIGFGYTLTNFPLYASAIGIQRSGFAALLTPIQGGGLRMIGEPCYLIEGNLAVRVQKGGKTYFIWKSQEVAATPEMLTEFARFVVDLAQVLLPSQ